MLVPARELCERSCHVPDRAHCGLNVLKVLRPIPGTSAAQLDLAPRVQHTGQQVTPVTGIRVAQHRQTVAHARGQGVVAWTRMGSLEPLHPLCQHRARPFYCRPGIRVQQLPDVSGPTLRSGSRKGPVCGLHLIAPRNHPGKLGGRRERTELSQGQRPVIVRVRCRFQGVDTCPRQFVLGLVIREDPRRGIDGRLHRVLAQHPVAQRVDRADDGLIEVRSVMAQLIPREYLAADALTHLGGRGIGEGDSSHLGDAVLPEEGDVPLHEDAGLAAPGSGRDQHVAATLGHDAGLLRSQSHLFDLLNPFTRQMWRNEQ